MNDAKVIMIDSLNGYLNAMPDERILTTHLHELFITLDCVECSVSARCSRQCQAVKEESTERIDGMVAAIMALGRLALKLANRSRCSRVFSRTT